MSLEDFRVIDFNSIPMPESVPTRFESINSRPDKVEAKLQTKMVSLHLVRSGLSHIRVCFQIEHAKLRIQIQGMKKKFASAESQIKTLEIQLEKAEMMVEIRSFPHVYRLSCYNKSNPFVLCV